MECLQRWVELWESSGEEALLMVAAQLKKVIHQSFSPAAKKVPQRAGRMLLSQRVHTYHTIVAPVL